VIDLQYWSIERAAGFFLVLSFAANLAGVLMFLIRGGISGGVPPSHARLVWERSLLSAAVILTALGLVLLDGHLQNTDGRILARTGATAYLFGGLLVVAAEALNLNPGPNTYPLIVIYVLLALLAQATMGGSLLLAGLLPAWIGWITILWNIAWLIVLPVASRRDIYYPGLHHIMPLVMGIALLLK
jgi:hypothetical protein